MVTNSKSLKGGGRLSKHAARRDCGRAIITKHTLDFALFVW